MHVDPSRELSPAQSALLTGFRVHSLVEELVQNGPILSLSPRGLWALASAMTERERGLIKAKLHFGAALIGPRGLGGLLAMATAEPDEPEDVTDWRAGRITDDLEVAENGGSLGSRLALAELRFEEILGQTAPCRDVDESEETIAVLYARAILGYAPDDETTEELLASMRLNWMEKEREALAAIFENESAPCRALVLARLAEIDHYFNED